MHRITGGEESYCFLQSNRLSEDRLTKELVFQGSQPGYPARCDTYLSSICPFREIEVLEEGKGRLLYCCYCKRRHRAGSTAKRLCEDWHSVKSVLKQMRETRPGGRLYFVKGTTLLPYRPDTPDLVRQLIWMRLKGAVARRDAHTCQDCGEVFGGIRRKMYDQNLRSGKGGYRWESLEIHHIIPRSKGGNDHPGNLKTLCPTCHRKYTLDQLHDRADERRKERVILEATKSLSEELEDWDCWGE